MDNIHIIFDRDLSHKEPILALHLTLVTQLVAWIVCEWSRGFATEVVMYIKMEASLLEPYTEVEVF